MSTGRRRVLHKYLISNYSHDANGPWVAMAWSGAVTMNSGGREGVCVLRCVATGFSVSGSLLSNHAQQTLCVLSTTVLDSCQLARRVRMEIDVEWLCLLLTAVAGRSSY